MFLTGVEKGQTVYFRALADEGVKWRGIYDRTIPGTRHFQRLECTSDDGETWEDAALPEHSSLLSLYDDPGDIGLKTPA